MKSCHALHCVQALSGRHLCLCLQLLSHRSVHAWARRPFEKHWPFTAATDRCWWSAWRVVVRQLGLISLWAIWCCTTLQEVLPWACKASSQVVTFLGWGKEKHWLSCRDPRRTRACCSFPQGEVYYRCLSAEMTLSLSGSCTHVVI